MTNEEIVKALRLCAVADCGKCNGAVECGGNGCCCDALNRSAADRLEELLDRCARYAEEIAMLRERQRWIPVTERLPEPETRVLVLDRYGHMMDRTMRQLPTDKTPVFRPDGLMPGKHVTHWMPLPPAPEVE